MKWFEFNSKVKRRVWGEIVSKTRDTNFYDKIYISYWHSYLFPGSANDLEVTSGYLSSVPNPGAGIGHQLSNWIAGYWFASMFNLKFAHIPFSDPSWDSLLNFGSGEIIVRDLLLKNDYKKVLLPLFDEENAFEVQKVRHIIDSYRGSKVVFITEQDQFHRKQYTVIKSIRDKFLMLESFHRTKLVFSTSNFNIAIHVRRGDIVDSAKNPNLQLRWQDDSYFDRVLQDVMESIKVDKPIHIYFFSQGKPSDFDRFSKVKNLHFCLEMDAQRSFLHLAYSDVLITSKSSFSYKAALLNTRIKISPKNFWHNYPKCEDWILVEENGALSDECKHSLIKLSKSRI
jgi:hypothetical protein